MKSKYILQTRLHNQHLSNPNFTTAADVVKWFGAVQAQEYEQSLFSIGLRMKSAVLKDVEKAIHDRKIVRTWPMRGTLHFVPAEDAHWMLDLLTPRVIKKFASILRKVEVDEEVLKKSRKFVEKTLSGGKSISRNELMKKFDENGIVTKNQRGYQILAVLSQQGLVCFGEKQGKQQSLVLMDEWIPKSKELSTEEALAKLTLTFFQSHGPATIQDLMWWAGLTTKEVQRGIELNKNNLLEEVIDDVTYYSSNRQSEIIKSERAFLLPAYDEYTIAYKDRNEMVIDSSKVLFTGNGFWSSMILGGKIVGMWRRDVLKDQILIQCAPIGKLSKHEKEWFQEAVERYGKFFGMESEMKYVK